MRLPNIEVKLTLLTKSEGGRKKPLFFDKNEAPYRPHIVIGDASQKEPIIKNGRLINEE